VAVIVRVWFAFVATLALAGCDRCRDQPAQPATTQSARPRERAAIDHLVTGRSDLPPDLAGFDSYGSLMRELERNPEETLLAVRERRAQSGSRDALFLKVLEQRFIDVAGYRRRLEILDKARRPAGHLGTSYELDVSGLTGSDADAVWTEVLLLESGMARSTAILHLDRIGTPLAIEALAYAASTDQRSFGSEEAARALGRRGEAERLVTALVAWESSVSAPEAAGPLAGLAYLRPDAHARANNALLAGLQAADATPKRRTLLLHGLAITGEPGALVAAHPSVEAPRHRHPQPGGRSRSSQHRPTRSMTIHATTTLIPAAPASVAATWGSHSAYDQPSLRNTVIASSSVRPVIRNPLGDTTLTSAAGGASTTSTGTSAMLAAPTSGAACSVSRPMPSDAVTAAAVAPAASWRRAQRVARSRSGSG
jgi:hypothetical protein